MGVMKTLFELSSMALLIAGLSACVTIDEERFANVPCKDLKQLVATDHLVALSQPQDTGLYQVANDRDNQEIDNIFDFTEEEKKRQAELRAAYRNNCR